MYNNFGGYNSGFNPQPMQQPIQPSMPYLPDFSQPKPTQPTNINWIYVNGIDGAKSQIVQPGQTSWMMDNNEPVIYVKTVDGMGTATLKAFKLTEINAPTPSNNNAVDLSDYVQKKDVADVLSRLQTLEDLIGGLNA